MPKPWFRLYTEILDDPKIWTLLPEERWVWVALLALAGRIGMDGKLTKWVGKGYTSADISQTLRVDLPIVESALSAFSERDMVDFDGETWSITHWASRQYESDSSTERTRAYRHRLVASHETSQKRHRNVTVTPPESESESESDTDNTPPTPLKGGDARAHARETGETLSKARPPDQDALTEYLLALGGTETDASAYWDHYTANGWRVGKAPMKDWQAAARNWLRRTREYATAHGAARRNGKEPVMESLKERSRYFQRMLEEIDNEK